MDPRVQSAIDTARSRHCVDINFVRVQPVQGSTISLVGFPDGDEIVYGVLLDWWSSQQNR